jgi:hypothetical protein
MLAACSAVLSAGEVVLWPSEKTELRAQPDSKIETLPDGAMSVTTGVKYRWPGLRMDFLAGECDLSEYGSVVVSVSNTTDRPQVVHLSVKARLLQGANPGDSVALAPHAAGELLVSLHNMPWALDSPLELHGMRGFPKARGGGSTFDLRRTSSFHIFLLQNGEAGGFSVRRIVASEAGMRQKVLQASSFLPFVDRYGQFAHDDWPGKIHDDGELEASRKAEDAWLNGHSCPIPDADRFGGWAGGPRLKATGFFRTEKVDGKWWLVDPDGYLFFSHGVDCVGHGGATGVEFRERYFSWLPAKDDPDFGEFWGRINWPAAHGFYKEKEHLPFDTFDFHRANARRKYGPGWKRIGAELTHARMRTWGLNTIANWSNPEIYGMRKTPYTVQLGTSGTPRLEGSKGWWGALPDPFNPEFEATLRRRAKDMAKTMRDDPWCVGIFVDNELSWNDEPRMKDVAEQYFSTVRRVLREELPNHLYLGCRIAWGREAIYEACARHCDVVSVNIYSRVPSRDLPPAAEDKPMIVGEFHFGALDRGLFHTGLVATRDQAERAACYRAFVNDCLDHPRFVGAHWFQWRDQPLTGRADGENYQIGFLTVTDTPYPELVDAAREVARTMYRRRSSAAFNVNDNRRKGEQ